MEEPPRVARRVLVVDADQLEALVLAKYLEVLGKDKRFKLVGINYKDAPGDARRFLHKYGDPYLASGADRSGRTSINWGVYGVPETYVVNRKGIIIYKVVGPITDANLMSTVMPQIEKALKD